MNAKIRDFANLKTPYILVMGDKEAEARAVSVRTRGKGDQGSVSLQEFVARCRDLAGTRSVGL
jgi:threonyl-tRNA synthetase